MEIIVFNGSIGFYHLMCHLHSIFHRNETICIEIPEGRCDFLGFTSAQHRPTRRGARKDRPGPRRHCLCQLLCVAPNQSKTETISVLVYIETPPIFVGIPISKPPMFVKDLSPAQGTNCRYPQISSPKCVNPKHPIIQRYPNFFSKISYHIGCVLDRFGDHVE